MEVERQRQSLSLGGEERARHACVCLASDQMSKRNVAFGRGTLSREEDDGFLVFRASASWPTCAHFLAWKRGEAKEACGVI